MLFRILVLIYRGDRISIQYPFTWFLSTKTLRDEFRIRVIVLTDIGAYLESNQTGLTYAALFDSTIVPSVTGLPTTCASSPCTSNQSLISEGLVHWARPYTLVGVMVFAHILEKEFHMLEYDIIRWRRIRQGNNIRTYKGVNYRVLYVVPDPLL